MESKKLSEVVKENVGRPTYDYLLIDCPPTLSLLTINALVAADAVLPSQDRSGRGGGEPLPPAGRNVTLYCLQRPLFLLPCASLMSQFPKPSVHQCFH
jgi:hypothetical protein